MQLVETKKSSPRYGCHAAMFMAQRLSQVVFLPRSRSHPRHRRSMWSTAAARCVLPPPAASRLWNAISRHRRTAFQRDVRKVAIPTSLTHPVTTGTSQTQPFLPQRRFRSTQFKWLCERLPAIAPTPCTPRAMSGSNFMPSSYKLCIVEVTLRHGQHRYRVASGFHDIPPIMTDSGCQCLRVHGVDTRRTAPYELDGEPPSLVKAS